MQTFLPSSNFIIAAQILDSKRLNKQILETYQILNILTGNSKSNAWKNHPAVLMWEGAESELYRYGMTAIVLADMRGIKVDKNLANMQSLVKSRKSLAWQDNEPLWSKTPSILKRVNATHKANLALVVQRQAELDDAQEKHDSANEKYNTATTPEEKDSAEISLDRAKKTVDNKKSMLDAAKHQAKT